VPFAKYKTRTPSYHPEQAAAASLELLFPYFAFGVSFNLSSTYYSFQQPLSIVDMRLPVVFFAACCALLALHCAEAAKARHFKWEVSNMFWSPDCEEKVLIGINGQFPGPTIRAKAGDTIVVELKNALHTEGVVIHWHGIRQVTTYHEHTVTVLYVFSARPAVTCSYRAS
jgi:hypothetical protein